MPNTKINPTNRFRYLKSIILVRFWFWSAFEFRWVCLKGSKLNLKPYFLYFACFCGGGQKINLNKWKTFLYTGRRNCKFLILAACQWLGFSNVSAMVGAQPLAEPVYLLISSVGQLLIALCAMNLKRVWLWGGLPLECGLTVVSQSSDHVVEFPFAWAAKKGAWW